MGKLCNTKYHTKYKKAAIYAALRGVRRGFESHSLRFQKARIYAGFLLYCCMFVKNYNNMKGIFQDMLSGGNKCYLNMIT